MDVKSLVQEIMSTGLARHRPKILWSADVSRKVSTIEISINVFHKQSHFSILDQGETY